MTTEVAQFVGDLGAGVVEEKLSHILSEVAGAVTDHSKQGKVKIEFNIKQIGSGNQVMVSAKIGFSRPTARGDKSETDSTQTAMYVGTRGKMTIFPEDQTDMFNTSNEGAE